MYCAPGEAFSTWIPRLAPLLPRTCTSSGYPLNWHVVEPRFVTAKKAAECPLALGSCFESSLSDNEVGWQASVLAPVAPGDEVVVGD